MIIIGKAPLSFAAILAFGVMSSACTPAKAPGSNPEDMSPAEHHAAADAEEQKAAEHEQDKENVGPSKPNTELDQKAQHENEAETHRDYAEQHEHAAQAAEGSNPAPQKKK